MTRPPVTWEQTRAFRLARMHLVEPLGPRSLRRVARDLGGLHAQVSSAAELQCAVRMRGLKPGAVDRALWTDRTLIKTWMMRGTLHFVDAGDFPVWAAASRTRGEWRKPFWLKAYGLALKEVESAIEAVTEALDGRCLTREELSAEVERRVGSKAVSDHLRSSWGTVTKIVAGQGLLCFGPNEGRNVTFARSDQWVPGWHEVDTDVAILEVFRRYLSSHGPASREEFARWWGFRPAQATKVLSATDDLVELDRDGQVVVVLKRDLKAVRDAGEDRAVRLLGMFDPYTLAGLPHDEVVAKSEKSKVYRKGAWVSQTVVKGGRVVGVWAHARKTKGTTVEVTLFEPRSVPKGVLRYRLEAFEPFIGRVTAVAVT